jgi:uncharacterized repeat protein (TIGR01451 family)
MFTRRNFTRASRRVTLIILSAFMIFPAGLATQARTRTHGQGAKAKSVAPKSRAAKSSNLSRAAKRGNPLAREEGDRESAGRKGRHGKRAARSERTDQPAEAVKAELDARLPKGATTLPVERYFEAKEQMKQMPRFSTATGETLPSESESGEGDAELLTSRASAKGLSAPSADAGLTSGILGTWQPLGPGNVGGRTRAIIIDPTTPNTMYAAGVAGGVWKTTNGGASWSALDDFMANIAVTCLAFEPGNSSVIYAGTGEGFFNADGVQGAGIFKSSDAGATWARLASTTTSDFFFVNDLVVSNVNVQHLYAATRSGVWRSLDGGATWAMILNVPTVAPSATGVRGATDLVMRTDQATDYLFVAAGTAFNPGEPASHVYRSTDAANAVVVPTGTTPNAGSFTDVYSESGMGRTSLAIAPSNQNTIYAMADTSNSGSYNLGLLGVFRSTSSGDPGTWTTQVRNTSANKQDTLLLSNPVNAVLVECGFGPTNQFINQGWYDNQIAVDPTDENKVWAAGTDLFRSDNGGVNWGVASYWWFQGNGTPPNNGDPQLVHADNHTIVFAPGYNGTTNQTMIVGDDGGIYKTDNAHDGNVGYVNGTTPSGGTVTSTSPICGQEFTPGGFYTVPSPVIWGPLNNGYAVTQFWPGAVYPNGATYFGGTQDNGTNRGTDANGPNQWERILGGDGGFAAVDPTNTNVLYAENTGNSFQKSTNGGASFAAARTGISGDTFPFTSVFRMDPNNSARLWYAGRFMWRTDNSAGSWTRTSSAQQTGGSITAMAIAPGNSNLVIDGAASGQIRRTSIGTTATSTTPLTGAGSDPSTSWVQTFTPRGNGFGGISWLEYDPSNTNTVWATVSNFNSASSGNGFGHVFKSADGGATWTLADGSQTAGNAAAIPDIPAWSIAVDPSNGSRIYVGTDLGVFVTLDGGATWAKETTGFSNAVVKSLTILNVGGVSTIYAFTHGRGAFKVAIPASCASVPGSPIAVGSAGGATNVSVTSASNSCTWNAVSNNTDWIHVTGGSSGAGSGTVNLNIDQNTTGSSRTGTLTVAGQTVTIFQRALPAITWGNPADIIYGTALDGTQLNATANTPGTFTYTPAAGTVLSKGNGQTLHVDFAPTDTTNYDGASKDVSINVLSAVLNVSMIADRNPASVEQNFNYKATITNTGNASATNTVLTDVLPSAVTFTGVSLSQGTCSYVTATRTLTCNVGTIAAASNANVQITVKPRSEGTLDDTATITASQWDPATGNSSASVNGLSAQKFVDLAVSMGGSANPVFAGQNVTYTTTVKNVSTLFSATNVVLTDVLPASYNFASATTSQGSLITPPVGSNGTVTANIGTLAPGATATVTVTITSTSAGVVTNSASATSTEAESTPANNTGSTTTTVNAAGLLKVLLASQVLTGGCQNTTGNIYLTGPAGPGGLTVPLSSNITGASVSQSVFIPAGQTVSPTFSVVTSPVATKQVGLITAGSGQGSVSRGITINVGNGSCN